MRVLLVVTALVAALVPGASSADPLEHCSFRLVPVSKQGTTTTAAAELIGCYATYEEAIEEGFSGSVDIEAGATPGSLSDDALVSAQSFDVLIGTEYNEPGYTFASNSYYASTTCTASNTWQLNYVGSAYNDTFESGKGFGGCDVNRKWEHADFDGQVVICTPNCTNYGTLGNEISSLRWRH